MIFFIPIIFHLAFVEPARVSTWISQIRESNFLSSSPVSSFSALLVHILNYISIYLILNVKACTPMWRLLKLYWSRCGWFIFSLANVYIKMPYVSPVGEIIEYILGTKKKKQILQSYNQMPHHQKGAGIESQGFLYEAIILLWWRWMG